MTVALRLRQLAAGVCLAALTGTGYGAEQPLDLSLPASRFYTQEAQSFMLAANDVEATQAKTNTAPLIPAAEFEPKLFSKRKVHQYLGIGTVALAALTFATHTHPADSTAPRDVNSTHGQLGRATAVMALATVATGLYAHWDDFHLEDGWSDPDNLHVLLAATGAALMAYAIDKSLNQSTGQVSHAGMAELGAVAMVVAIKLTW